MNSAYDSSIFCSFRGGDVSYIQINGGISLEGEIKVQGSKNAVLPIMAASILNKGNTVIKGCPHIRDVDHMICLLEEIGCVVSWFKDSLTIDANEINTGHLEERYAKTMRSSVFFVGAMLGRMGYVKISYPGGCTIGKRPIDIHLNGLRQMDVEIIEEEDGVVCRAVKMKGADIVLPFPSVGATENIIMAAVMAEGMTKIQNPAREPEIIELCCFLRKMGADIRFLPDGSICIKGKKTLHDVEYKVAADRIVAGTYLAALAGTGGSGILKADCGNVMASTIQVLRMSGCKVSYDSKYIWIQAPECLSAVPVIETMPYPGFPTDMQSQMIAVLSTAKGKTVVIENIFEFRYESVKELRKLGADIFIDKKKAVITGVNRLQGETVEAKELRGGAALVLAGLKADETTIVKNISYIERGYENICENLSMLGAKICVIQDCENAKHGAIS